MKLLIRQNEKSIFLDGIDLDEIISLDDSCKKNFTSLLKYKFENDNMTDIFYKEYDEKLCTIKEIYVEEEQYDKIRKEIYLFAELACSKNVKPNSNSIRLKNISKILNYSNELVNNKRYHLINLEEQKIFISKMTNTDIMLDKWYNDKVLTKKK